MTRTLSSTLSLAVLACSLSACGAPAASTGRDVLQSPVPPPAEPAAVVARGSIALATETATEPLLTLDADGTVHHAVCEAMLGEDGQAIDRAGVTLLAVRGEEILDGRGRVIFRIEGERLVRADGRAAILDADLVRFDGSPPLVLRVEGASDPGLRRTALVLVALLSLCEG